jgi:hypothetical protein
VPPDKVADHIAGAIADLAYAAQKNPKVAVEVLIGHSVCHAIIETSAPLETLPIEAAIRRIAGSVDPMWSSFPRTVIWLRIRRVPSAAATMASSRASR